MYPYVADMLAQYDIQPFAEMPTLAVCKSFEAASRAISCHTPYYGAIITTPEILELYEELEGLQRDGFPQEVILRLKRQGIESCRGGDINAALKDRAFSAMRKWQSYIGEDYRVVLFNSMGQNTHVGEPHIDGGINYLLTTESTTHLFNGLFSDSGAPNFPTKDSPYVSVPCASGLLLNRKPDPENQNIWLAVPHRGGFGPRLTMSASWHPLMFD